MARISTYDNDSTVTGSDRIIGTDSSNTSTKNFTVTDLRTFVLADGVFNGLIPQDRYATVGANNQPKQAQIYETSVNENNVAISTNFVVSLSRDGIGFVLSISRFGSVLFPYDISSFIGKTWRSDEYTTAADQVITSFLDQPFVEGTAANNQTWRFRTTIEDPLPIDLPSGSVGRAMTNTIVSSANRQTVEIGSGVRILGLPTSNTSLAAGTLYTQTGAQLGLSGGAASLKIVLEA